MIRKFTFEAEIYDSLNCLPLAARRKLDALGIKLHLAQWGQFGRGERLMICHAPTDSDDERSALRIFIEEVALARTGSPAKALHPFSILLDSFDDDRYEFIKPDDRNQ